MLEDVEGGKNPPSDEYPAELSMRKLMALKAAEASSNEARMSDDAVLAAVETGQGYISEVTCMDCNQVLVWPIAERTGIQDHTRLRCQTQSCKQFGKVWQRPVVKLWPG
jgi:hypothetical protein